MKAAGAIDFLVLDEARALSHDIRSADDRLTALVAGNVPMGALSRLAGRVGRDR